MQEKKQRKPDSTVVNAKASWDEWVWLESQNKWQLTTYTEENCAVDFIGQGFVITVSSGGVVIPKRKESVRITGGFYIERNLPLEALRQKVESHWRTALELKDTEPWKAMNEAKEMLLAACQYIFDLKKERYNLKWALKPLYKKVARIYNLPSGNYIEDFYSQVVNGHHDFFTNTKAKSETVSQNVIFSLYFFRAISSLLITIT